MEVRKQGGPRERHLRFSQLVEVCSVGMARYQHGFLPACCRNQERGRPVFKVSKK